MDSKVTTKGQTTIPKPIRDHLRLDAGGRVKYVITPNGQVVMLPKLPASALQATSRYKGPTVTLDAMDEAIAAGGAGEPPPQPR